MNKGRFEAFNDAIIAIIVTLLVLEIKRPDSYTFTALAANWRSYGVYIVTFLQIMAVWYNHHNLLQYATHFNHRFYWANVFWLLMLSSAPFATSWLSDYPNQWQPETFYVGVWFLWSIAYTIAEVTLLHLNPRITLIDHYERWIYVVMGLTVLVTRFIPFAGIISVSFLTLWLILRPIKYELKAENS